jgi:site-specific recombinase XerD
MSSIEDKKAVSMKLSEAFQQYLDSINGIRAPGTVYWYKTLMRRLLRVLGDLEIETITIQNLRSWRSTLYEANTKYGGNCVRPRENGKLSEVTIYGTIKSCRTFFRWLTREGLLEDNPAERLVLPKTPKRHREGIKDADRDKMLEWCKAS